MYCIIVTLVTEDKGTWEVLQTLRVIQRLFFCFSVVVVLRARGTLSMKMLEWTNRSTASPGPALGQDLFVKISYLTTSSLVGHDLSVLCQVQSCDFFRLFDLFVVRSNFALELINQSLHSFVILPVFILLIAQFLDVSLRLPQVLLCIRASPGLSIQLGF